MADDPQPQRFLHRYYVKCERSPIADTPTLSSPRQVATVLREMLRPDEPREHFYVFYLGSQNEIFGFELIALGSANEVRAPAAEVYRGALLSGARAIIAAHNHPSGDARPSPADDSMTRALYAGGELLGVPLLDSVVVTTEELYSYAGNERGPFSKKKVRNAL